jgi:hypothetical protein
MAGCDRHPFDQAAGQCRACRTEFCATCLVYPFGHRKPPLCVACALAAGGVRRSSGRVAARAWRR